MKITIKLFATLREYLKEDEKGVKVLDVHENTTVKEVLGLLKIPNEIPKIILINGKQKDFEDTLKDGDTLSVFPPIAGG